MGEVIFSKDNFNETIDLLIKRLSKKLHIPTTFKSGVSYGVETLTIPLFNGQKLTFRSGDGDCEVSIN